MKHVKALFHIILTKAFQRSTPIVEITTYNTMPKGNYFYAVAEGRNPGIYCSWAECSAQVAGYSGGIYKKFSTRDEAENFVQEKQNHGSSSHSPACNSSHSNYPRSNIARKPLSANYKRAYSTSSSDDEPIELFRVSKKIKISSSNDNCGKRGGYVFNKDEDGYVEVYTDGACSNNGGKNPQAGIGVWFGENHPLNVSQPVIGRATNNMAEIQAVTKALETAKKAGIKKLKINTDSKFLISCITQWMPKWKRNGWITANNKPVINKTELIEMENALSSMEVTWNHVRGHQGIKGNEAADQLARAGCSRYKP